jgi:hypothetical protein
MLNPNETFYLKFEEPIASCLLALKTYILSINPCINFKISWGMPFFTYCNKSLCYLWIDKKSNTPYIGFMDGNLMQHHALVLGDRKRIKILLINLEEDLPI